MEPFQPKHCPICNHDLPISDFGIVKARAHLDGRNLYCKECIRLKIKEQRRAQKEYKAIRKQYQAQGLEYHDERFAPVRYLSPAEKIKEAIRNGHRTWQEIRSETKLGKDEIGDVIANLLLWTREIRTQVIDGTRLYFENKPGEKPQPVYKSAIPFAELSRKSNQLFVKGERRIRRVA